MHKGHAKLRQRQVESFHQLLWKPLSSSRQPCSSCSLSPDQLDQLGKHGTPHRPRDQPADHTGGKSHVDLALITKSDDTSLHQELGLLNSSLGCLTVPRSRSLSDIVHVAGDIKVKSFHLGKPSCSSSSGSTQQQPTGDSILKHR